MNTARYRFLLQSKVVSRLFLTNKFVILRVFTPIVCANLAIITRVLNFETDQDKSITSIDFKFARLADLNAIALILAEFKDSFLLLDENLSSCCEIYAGKAQAHKG